MASVDLALERARLRDDEDTDLLLQLIREQIVCGIEGRSYDRVRELADEGLARFEATANEHGLLHVWWAVKNIAELEMRHRDAAVAAGHALEIARRLDLAHVEHDLVQSIATLMVFNDTPAEHALRFIEENEPVFAVRQIVGFQKALLLAMLGRAEEARTNLEQTVHVIRERGGPARPWDTRWYLRRFSETMTPRTRQSSLICQGPKDSGRASTRQRRRFSRTRSWSSDDSPRSNPGFSKPRRRVRKTT